MGTAQWATMHVQSLSSPAIACLSCLFPCPLGPGPSNADMGVGEISHLGGLPWVGSLEAFVLIAPQSFLFSVISRDAMTW